MTRGRMSQFSSNLKKYRLLAGYMTAKEFAKVLEVPYPTYVSYKSNNREPKYDVLCKISYLLNVSIDELLGNEFTRNTKNTSSQAVKPERELSLEICKCIKRTLGTNEIKQIFKILNKFEKGL